MIISRDTSCEDGNFLCFIFPHLPPPPPWYTSNFLHQPQAKYSCVQTDSWASSCPLFLLPYSETTASPASLRHPPLPRHLVWPWVMFQEDIYKTFLFITSCKSFQSIHLKKKKKKKKSHFTQCFRTFFGARNARDSKQGYWRHFSQTHQMERHPESDHFQIIVRSVSPSHRFASVFLLCVMTCLTAERLLRVLFVQS